MILNTIKKRKEISNITILELIMVCEIITHDIDILKKQDPQNKLNLLATLCLEKKATVARDNIKSISNKIITLKNKFALTN